MRVAIQGTHGSFSEAAARRRWPGLETLPCREAKDVVAAVREGRADAGCLPIENSLIGSVTTTYDLLEEAFGDGALRLTHEILYPVHHTLMAVPGATLGGIKRVLSHPVALGQCRLWLGEHLPDVELVSAWDTAGSAEIVAQEGTPRSPRSRRGRRPTATAWFRSPSGSRTIPPIRPGFSPSPAPTRRSSRRPARGRSASRPR